MATKTKLSDDHIVAMLQAGIGMATGSPESRLSRERQRTEEYYNGDKPSRRDKASSSYTSYDVFESVEMMKAQLLETFTGNGRPVKFKQVQGETEDAAKARTDYITDVIFNQQGPDSTGFTILQDWIHDGLLNRAGVVKVFWEDKIDELSYDIRDTNKDELIHFLMTNDARVEEITLHEDGQTIKRARLTLKKDRSQVRLRVLPGEEFFISPMATGVAGSELCGDRRLVTISELLKLGFDRKVVMKLQDNDSIWLATEPELSTRHGDTDDIIGLGVLDNGQKARKRAMLYECYLELDVEDDGDEPEGSGTSWLYKVMLVGNTILDKERVDRRPYVPFIPLPQAHKFWGNNYAAQLIATQVASTYLTRSIVDHALITNNPRYLNVRGGLMNPRELMENRFGGIVNVTRPDAVVPLQQAGLNPFVFQTVSMLGSKREGLTGISAVSQGLDKDAISKQNSGDMVHELITVSQIRQKIIARNFAERSLRHLYTMVYQLVLENEDRKKIIQVAGSWTPIDMTAWPETCDMEVDFALGYGEGEKEATKWLTLDKYMSSDPELKQLYPLNKRFNVIRRAVEASGIKDVQLYMLTPEQVQPPPPNPMQAAELEVKQADAAVKRANANAAVQKLQLDQQVAQQEAQERLTKFNLETSNAMGKLQLEKDKLAHKVAVDAAEITLQKEAQAQDKLQAEAQPTRG